MAQTGHSDDLDQLLDSALDDFQTLNLASSAQSRDDGVKKSEGFSNVSRVEGLGMGLPKLGRKKKGKKKVKVASHVSETLKKLRQQTTEAVKGMESVAASKASGVDAFGFGFGEDALIEDWVKQLEEVAGSQDMESIVETMMQQLLSEEVVDDPIKEIGERYPKWLQDNKSNLEKAEYDRYFHQHQLIKDLNQIDPANSNKILDLMHKLQESGQPPTDILKDLAPDFDISALAQLSPEMLDSQENCCIM